MKNDVTKNTKITSLCSDCGISHIISVGNSIYVLSDDCEDYDVRTKVSEIANNLLKENDTVNVFNYGYNDSYSIINDEEKFALLNILDYDLCNEEELNNIDDKEEIRQYYLDSLQTINDEYSLENEKILYDSKPNCIY